MLQSTLLISYVYPILTMAAYFYFNWRYFTWIAAALPLPRVPWLPVTGAFIINYLLFYVCSQLELNLIINWAVFFVFLFAETTLYCGGRRRSSFFFSLVGILCGLCINIFCRCFVSIAAAQPLADFDNHISNAGNIKGLPVFLGFLLGGIVLQEIAGSGYVRKIRVLLSHPQHLAFLLEVMSGMFLYLFLNLLIYQSRDNGILLKLWGIKSCVFSLVGTFLAMRYSLEMCELSDYRDINRAIRLELDRRQQEEAGLRTVAYQDTLTGTYNRPYAMEEIGRLLRQREPFVLCFADLDHLKEINDRRGHAEGDRYLISAAQALGTACRKERDLLCRYGGDEFLLLMRDATVSIAEERIRSVDRCLRQAGESGAAPFPMSLSWGIVNSDPDQDMESLIRAADTMMYEQKRAKYLRAEREQDLKRRE